MENWGEKNGAYWNARYIAAYNDVDARVAAREHVLMGYIGAAGALVGIAVGKGLHHLGLMIPYVGMAAALILFNHEKVMGQLEEYMFKLVKQARDNGIDVKGDWYDQERLGRDRALGLVYRTAAMFVIMFGFSYAALFVISWETEAKGVWWGGLVFGVASLCLVVWVRIKRLYKMGWSLLKLLQFWRARNMENEIAIEQLAEIVQRGFAQAEQNTAACRKEVHEGFEEIFRRLDRIETRLLEGHDN